MENARFFGIIRSKLKRSDMKNEYRFIVDTMLGRLAKWLRLMGYDTLYIYPIEDRELVRIAVRDRRILVTRDTRLIARKSMPDYVLIRSTRIRRQIRELMDTLGISPQADKIFTRCTLCNTLIQRTDKKEVEGLVPEYTYRTHEDFYRCPGCGQIYWEGTHLMYAKEELNRIGINII